MESLKGHVLWPANSASQNMLVPAHYELDITCLQAPNNKKMLSPNSLTLIECQACTCEN